MWRQRFRSAGLGALLLSAVASSCDVGCAIGHCCPCGALGADEAAPGLMSGLQPGEKVPTFYVRAVTGPLRNKSVCYVCRNGERPTAMVLVREATPELARLLKGIDGAIDAHRAQGLRGFCVFLAGEDKNPLPAVQTLAFDEKLSLPLTICAAPVTGPAGQKVHADAAVTIVLYREQTVIANFAFRRGELTMDAAARVLKAVERLAVEDAAGG